MKIELLNDDSFMLFAAQNYYNPTCIDAEEFNEDLKRFKYVKRLINRYHSGGKLSVNLILNHVVVILNVFGIDSGLRMFEYKLDEDHWSVVKPFLVYLKAIDNDKYTGITMDPVIIDELRKI